MPRSTESEADFQSWVTDMLLTYGWRQIFEDLPLRKCACGRCNPPPRKRGHPDLEIVRGERLMFMELKSEKGKVQPEQREVIAALRDVKDVHAGIYRPIDRDHLQDLLR